MARIKVPRKSTAIDMTAMCDVAFLLLTFFIMTAKPKTEDPVPIDTPKSSIQVLVPENDFATVSVGEDKAFFGIEGVDLRKETLSRMAELYNTTFTPDEVNKFATLTSFGIPFNQLKQFLNLTPEQRKKINQPGIPRDTVSHELGDWVLMARNATVAIHDVQLRVAIKGDSKEDYPIIKEIIDLFGKQRLFKFSLITDIGSNFNGSSKK